MDKIEELRHEIDIIDSKLMKLLNMRYEISKRIGKIKSNSKKDVLDKQRENHVLNKTKNYDNSEEIESVYKTIMRESKNIQRK